MSDLLVDYYFKAYGGKPMKAGDDSNVAHYFETVKVLFGLERPEAERVLMNTRLSNDRAEFWAQRLGTLPEEWPRAPRFLSGSIQ